MLKNNTEEHAKNASKVYAFDFINNDSVMGSASDDISTEPDSPFSWKEEENNVEYYKPTVKLEIKKRMSVQKCDDKVNRLSFLPRVSIFS